jgi:hypothetical protein
MLHFTFVANDIMPALLSIPIPINIGYQDKLRGLRVINAVPLLDKNLLIFRKLLHDAFKIL